MRRRFIAFITLLVSAFVILLGNFTNVFTGINVGTEYGNSKSYVYRVTNSEDLDVEVDMNKAALEMNRRLKGANVNNFDVSIEGNDQIRVTFNASNQSEEEHIKKLLAYNARFSLTTTDDVQESKYGEESYVFEGSVARVEFRGQYPVVVIPVSNTTKLNEIVKHAQEVKNLDGSEESGDPNADENSIDYTMIVLWANKVEGDSFEAAMDPENENYAKMQEKVLMAFSSSDDSLYFNKDKTEIGYAISVNADETTGAVNPLDARNAATEAQRKCDLFNAGAMDYEVNFLYSTPANASVENLINYGSYANINWGSRVVISTLVAIVLVAICLVIFYKLNAPVALVTTLGSLLATLAVFNLFGVEFSIGAVVGLVVVAALGIFSNVYYFEKLKNELYRGRTLKKANTEASKKATMPVIDASVVVLLASLITFFVGEPLVKSFAVIASLGSIFNLIFCLLGTKGLMWLLTNDAWMQEHKQLLNIDVTKIPNTANEETQTYFGPFDGKNVASKSKKVGLFAAIATVLGIAATLVFNFTIGTFNYEGSSNNGIRVQIAVEDNSEINKVEMIANDLEALGFEVGNEGYATGDHLDKIDVTLNYYTVDIYELPGEDSVVFEDLEAYDNNKIETIQAYLESYYQGIDSDAEVKVFNVSSISHTVNVWTLGLGVLFGLLLSGLYITLRYGISKSLTSFIVGLASTFITLALFIIFRISFVDIAALGLLAIMNISLLLSLLVHAREKEIHDEIKDENADLLIKANDSAFAPMFNIVTYGIFALLAFVAFGPANYTIVFILMMIGLLLSLLLNSSLVAPLFSALKKAFAKLMASRPHKEKKNKKKKTVTKSNEPEEAIFIGIND